MARRPSTAPNWTRHIAPPNPAILFRPFGAADAGAVGHFLRRQAGSARPTRVSLPSIASAWCVTRD